MRRGSQKVLYPHEKFQRPSSNGLGVVKHAKEIIWKKKKNKKLKKKDSFFHAEHFSKYTSSAIFSKSWSKTDFKILKPY